MSEHPGPDAPQKIVSELVATLYDSIAVQTKGFEAWAEGAQKAVDESPARIQALIDAEATLLDEAVKALELVKKRWKFNKDQQHMHTWHDWADCIGPIEAVLAKHTRPT